ncbi:hypothetical protein [Geminicoccus roseus]|uniref:hypothetical protein n=1 Tax=Geminicoccus roseus TaxID=404900 RepID=UPI0004215254|nr:hypothetical protein [Geminicoccus roseus]
MPIARSPAQIEAARRNGARSRGPATEEGKAASARNALRHGLCAREIRVLAGEDAEAYERLRLAMLDRCAGDDDPLRICLTELLVDNVWRQFRLSRQETEQHARLDAEADHLAGEGGPAPDGQQRLVHLARYRAQHLREFKELMANLDGRRPPVPQASEPGADPWRNEPGTDGDDDPEDEAWDEDGQAGDGWEGDQPEARPAAAAGRPNEPGNRRHPQPATPAALSPATLSAAERSARDRQYWEDYLDAKLAAFARWERPKGLPAPQVPGPKAG